MSHCNVSYLNMRKRPFLDVRNERKRVSRKWKNAYLSTENPKASRALKRALDPSCIWLALHMIPLCYIGKFLVLEGIFHFQKNQNLLSWTYINYKLKILKKRYQEKWENAYLTLKNTRASRALRWPWTPANVCSLHSLSGAARHRQLSEKIAGPPPSNPGSAPDPLPPGRVLCTIWSLFHRQDHLVLSNSIR